MNRVLQWIILLVLVVVMPQPANLHAQGPHNPYAPQQQNADPRLRRAWREQAIAYAGADSRAFVEKEGDAAVVAISALTPSGARKLVEFYASGDLGKLPRPADLLRLIAQPGMGDDVLIGAIQRKEQLTDIDNFDAYLTTPLEICYSLKSLEQGAAEARARRLSIQAAVTPVYPSQSYDWKSIGIVAALVCIVLVMWWRKRRQESL